INPTSIRDVERELFQQIRCRLKQEPEETYVLRTIYRLCHSDHLSLCNLRLSSRASRGVEHQTRGSSNASGTRLARSRRQRRCCFVASDHFGRFHRQHFDGSLLNKRTSFQKAPGPAGLLGRLRARPRCGSLVILSLGWASLTLVASRNPSRLTC